MRSSWLVVILGLWIAAAFANAADTSTLNVTVVPSEGVYHNVQKLSFSLSGAGDAYYSFDPSAPTSSFLHYETPVTVSQGTALLRYYAKGISGWQSPIYQATYVIDTVVPVLIVVRKSGADADSIILSVKKNAVIKYTVDGTVPDAQSLIYTAPIIVPHQSRLTLKAFAQDVAGNVSDMFEWTNSYTAPAGSSINVAVSQRGGLFNKPIQLTVSVNKSAKIFYTLDGSDPSAKVLLYRDGISISKEGLTTLRLLAIDGNGTASSETVEQYILDTKPPEIRAGIEKDSKDSLFRVTLSASEDARIYYEIGQSLPTMNSHIYEQPVLLQNGQVLHYFGVDRAGNASVMRTLNDIQTPTTIIVPKGGTYTTIFKAVILNTTGTKTFWRMLPDTQFVEYSDSIPIVTGGLNSIEYYSINQTGLRSPLWRVDYTIDMAPPRVVVNVRKEANDSVAVFFKCNKNANIFLTTDGSNPLTSQTVRMLANKYSRSEDRLMLQKNDKGTIAFYAEDLAGNQSPITIMDVFNPQVFANIPAGKTISYNFIVSVSLSAMDPRAKIYYARHGQTPTTASTVFSEPITLSASDTIMAFVVDPSGFMGTINTFIYTIDLPPICMMSISPDSTLVDKPVQFDASGSTDRETPLSNLLFRWDFNGDGIFDSDYSHNSRVNYTYKQPGIYDAIAEVKDVNNSVATVHRQVKVFPDCPSEMVPVVEQNMKVFCIDRYEWPNIQGKKPQTMVSWVVAKMTCMEAGKRLCLPEEWMAACKGQSDSSYPYGNEYSDKACPTEGESVYPSGSFSRCTARGIGAYDMVGNVWEWVEGKNGDYPRMFGGAVHYGKSADCTLSSEGSVGTKSNEVGFRCCK